jgi:hypothetical protein
MSHGQYACLFPLPSSSCVRVHPETMQTSTLRDWPMELPEDGPLPLPRTEVRGQVCLSLSTALWLLLFALVMLTELSQEEEGAHGRFVAGRGSASPPPQWRKRVVSWNATVWNRNGSEVEFLYGG